MRRMWKGTCVDDRSTSRSSSSSQPIVAWGSIGVCCICWTSKVVSKTWSACANAASISASLTVWPPM